MALIQVDFDVEGQRREVDFSVRNSERIEVDFVVETDDSPAPTTNPVQVLEADPFDSSNLACPPETSTLRAVYGDLRTGKLLGQLPLTAAAYSDVFNGAGNLSVTVPLVVNDGRGPFDLEPWNSTLWIFEGTQPLKGGIFLQRQVTGETVTFTGEGFHAYLRRRHVLDGLTLDDDQAAIATALAGPPLEAIGIDIEAPNTGVTRQRTYPAWENRNVAEAFEQLAAVDNGFDFRYTHDYADGRPSTTLELDFPATGRDTGVVYQHLVNGIEITQIDTDGSIVSNVAVCLLYTSDAADE